MGDLVSIDLFSRHLVPTSVSTQTVRRFSLSYCVYSPGKHRQTGVQQLFYTKKIEQKFLIVVQFYDFPAFDRQLLINDPQTNACKPVCARPRIRA